MVRWVRTEAPRRVRIDAYFATWCALNMVLSIYNKMVLNVNSYPCLTCLFSLPVGLLMMLISWATTIAEPPKTIWNALFWVGVAYTIGHVAATMSMSKVAFSFTHVAKGGGDPSFSVLVSRVLLGYSFPASLYLPIIGGCVLAALNFNMIGFMLRNIFSKREPRRSL